MSQLPLMEQIPDLSIPQCLSCVTPKPLQIRIQPWGTARWWCHRCDATWDIYGENGQIRCGQCHRFVARYARVIKDDDSGTEPVCRSCLPEPGRRE